MWVVHWGLAPEAVLEGLGLPLWGPGVQVVQVWVAGVLAAPDTQRLGQQEIQCSRRVWKPVLANALQYSCLENPLLTEKLGRPQSTGSQKVKHDQSNPAHIDTNFFCLWQICPSESWAWRWCSCLACGDPGGTKCAGTWTASAVGVMALSESFFRASCSWWSEGLFGQSFSVALPVQALRVLSCLGSFSVVWCSSTKRGHPGWGPTL